MFGAAGCEDDGNCNLVCSFAEACFDQNFDVCFNDCEELQALDPLIVEDCTVCIETETGVACEDAELCETACNPFVP